jgi:hypothetical protein
MNKQTFQSGYLTLALATGFMLVAGSAWALTKDVANFPIGNFDDPYKCTSKDLRGQKIGESTIISNTCRAQRGQVYNGVQLYECYCDLTVELPGISTGGGKSGSVTGDLGTASPTDQRKMLESLLKDAKCAEAKANKDAFDRLFNSSAFSSAKSNASKGLTSTQFNSELSGLKNKLTQEVTVNCAVVNNQVKTITLQQFMQCSSPVLSPAVKGKKIK